MGAVDPQHLKLLRRVFEGLAETEGDRLAAVGTLRLLHQLRSDEQVRRPHFALQRTLQSGVGASLGGVVGERSSSMTFGQALEYVEPACFR